MPRRAPAKRIPVTVVTGFLGSGKTTALSRLLRRPELARTAVIINEIGEIGLDHDLVANASENVVELPGGCLCCAMRGDLLDTLRDLFRRSKHGLLPPFERVVVETTGLADPAPILHTLMRDRLVVAVYRLDGVVATVDCANGARTLDHHEESVKQVAVADRLLLTKADLVPPATVEALGNRLRALNPGAVIRRADHGRVEPSALFDIGLYDGNTGRTDVVRWLPHEPRASGDHGHDHHHAESRRHDERVQSYSMIRERPVRAPALSFFLETLIAHRGPDLLRVKGIVNVAEVPGHPAVIHGAQHLFHPVEWLERWPSADRRTRMVFVTRDLPRISIEGFLDALEAHAGRAPAPFPAATGTSPAPPHPPVSPPESGAVGGGRPSRPGAGTGPGRA